MGLRQQTFWLKAIFKNPALARWCLHWRSSLNDQRSPLRDELPWITYGVIDWLEKHLAKDMTVFEWGSGGSTLFLAHRVKSVVTIEHDSVWYQEVMRALEKKGYRNVLLKLVEPERSENIDPWYSTTDARLIDYSFEQYIKTIDAYSDGFFDLVFVDGRARPGCMKHAIPKIKKNGYLLLDNSERTEYETGWNLVQEWRNFKVYGPGPYADFPWETRIWQKRTK